MSAVLYFWSWLLMIPVGLLPHAHCMHGVGGQIVYAVVHPECAEQRVERCCWCGATHKLPLPAHCGHAEGEGHGPMFPRILSF